MKTPYFLYVGNAYPHKNLEILIDAFAALGGDTTLVLVGKDDYFYKRLKQSERVKTLGNRIVFKTSVSDRELGSLYRDAQAFVFPSLMEGFGLPAIEALAHGCPVICSDIPVFHEILGEAATYFDPNDVDRLTKILAVALEKRPRVDGSIVKKYSWQKMAKETLSVYENRSRL